MSITNDAHTLPDYRDPPVVETVFGLQFDPFPKMRVAHLGAFWKTLPVDEWPTVADAPLILPQFERLDDASNWSNAVRFHVSSEPGIRIQIKNQAGDRMIQLQNSRLHFNWLGTPGKPYPRYETVRTEFEAVLDRFRGFASDAGLGDLAPNQWEVTYVNQIPQGTVWETPVDWDFFGLLKGVPTIENLIDAESYTGEWHFVIPPKRGRLHIQWQHGKGEPQSNEFVRLTLTARGPLSASGDARSAVRDGLDLGRETIVHSFRELMSNSANQFWGLKHA